MNYYICTWDLDSTLADTRHRADFINVDDRENTDWVAYGNLCDGDTPTSLASTFRMLKDMGWLSFIITTRPRECEQATREWLDQHDLNPHGLYMKPAQVKGGSKFKLDTIRDIGRAYGKVNMHFDDWWSTNEEIEKQLGVNTVTVRVYNPSEVELKF